MQNKLIVTFSTFPTTQFIGSYFSIVQILLIQFFILFQALVYLVVISIATIANYHLFLP